MFLILAALLLLASAQSCRSITTCGECKKFTDDLNPYSSQPCDWCTYNSFSLGCFPYGKCPGGSSRASAGNCPVTADTCSLVTDCNMCIQRQDCRYCGYYYGTSNSNNNGGCVSLKAECPSGFYIISSCPLNASNFVPVIVMIACTCVGFLVGAAVYFTSLSGDVNRLQKAALTLFLVSIVFWGASFFSVLLSMRLNKKLKLRKCCNCYTFCVFFFGIHEILCVAAGFFTSISLDFSVFSSNASVTLVMGVPLAVGGILSFGIPRIAVSSCAARNKAKSDDDLRNELRRDDVAVVAPAPPVMVQAPAPHYSAYHYPPAPRHPHHAEQHSNDLK